MLGKCGGVIDGLVALHLWDSLSAMANGANPSLKSLERDDPGSNLGRSSLSPSCVDIIQSVCSAIELSAPDRSTWPSVLSSEVSNRALLSRPGGESGFVTS